MPKRIMCDSNIHDAVVSDPDLKELIDQRQSEGHIVFKITHVQQTQLSKIPDARNKGQASTIEADRVGAAVVVSDHSLWDEDRFGTCETDAAFAAIQKGNPKHTADAMIGATVLSDADILVTNDRNFRKKFEKLDSTVQVMSSDQLKSFLAGIGDTSTGDLGAKEARR